MIILNMVVIIDLKSW